MFPWEEDVQALRADVKIRQLRRQENNLLEKVRFLTSEVERLKRGDFTPEEFQNLCHNLHEKPGCTRESFEQGCKEYQNKLFGRKND